MKIIKATSLWVEQRQKISKKWRYTFIEIRINGDKMCMGKKNVGRRR